MATAPNKEADTITLNRKTIEFAMEYIGEELDTLYALATSIVYQIKPLNLKDPESGDNIVAFRLSEVLEERIGNMHFRNMVSDMLLNQIPRGKPL